ncbi:MULTISPECIES: glycerophosphodiester phosphodiesterase [Exiguobacterium]|uniref:glycerophosphodiester phosphodiesterase n=2 Tax=Bacillales Family XII. Incertae Sedis TaxID=539742 RepID=UPI00049414E9|nr:glycerophosphodiester phosphodiesterase [Exiguobacterium sp.]HCD59480.1 glycerophosphodiester phosphodiesterase [Exiguobacterium sp.]
MLKQFGLTMVAGAVLSTGLPTEDVSAHSKGTSLLDPNRIINVAHRGASGYAPEHTMPAYEMGHKTFKADYIEIDLQMTKDGQLIAMHDETVDRTTNGTGAVKDKTLAEIKKLDAGSWFNEANPTLAKKSYVGLKVPTLQEVLSKYGKHANYYIETKSPEVYPGMEQKLLDVLKQNGLSSNKVKSGQVLIQSFSEASLQKVRAIDPNVPLVQLMEANEVKAMTDDRLTAIRQYAVSVGPSFKALTRENVAAIRAHDLLLHPYTVNEKADMVRMLDYGVTGVFTNYADRFNDVVKGLYKK